MTAIYLKQEVLSPSGVKDLLYKCNTLFVPSLSEIVNIDDYSFKLAEHATFIIARKKTKIVGFMAFYLNNSIRQIYISIICVFDAFHGLSIGQKMINKLINNYSYGYKSLGLEVYRENVASRAFYNHLHFQLIEERGERLYMIKYID